MRALINRLRGAIRPASCPVPSPRPASLSPSHRKTLRLWLPLASFVVPTVITAYGFVIPRSCIAGVNGLTIGFGTTVVGACLTYAFGIRAALRR
jgi:hypothetical protein